MESNIFNNNLIIHSQIVRNVAYVDNINGDFNISNCDINFNLLSHNEDKRDFKVQLFLEVENFKIFVEGHYEVSEYIEEKKINEIIELEGLATLIPFLRYSIYTITSTTKEGGIYLPLINLQNLVKTQIEKNNKLKKQTSKKPNI